jgi:hypothetical protein
MRKTPDAVSRERQKIQQEMEKWRAGIASAVGSFQLDSASRLKVEQQVAFGNAQLLECKKKMAALRSKGMRVFWKN